MSQAKVDIEAGFEFVEKMLYDIAWAFTRRYSLDFQETKREVYWAYMIAADKFQSGRGMKFSSWIHFKVTRYMRGWIKERFSDPVTFVEEVREDALGPVPDTRDIIEECRDLSGDAREMLRLIFDVSDIGKTPRKIIQEVKRKLCFETGANPTQQGLALLELRDKLTPPAR